MPQRLQNYELPRQYKKASTVYIINYFIFVSTQYPTQRNGHTEIITDDRGHLNDPRLRSARSPWGDYLSTWQRPQKEIQLKVKTKLMTQQFQPPLVLSPALRQLSQGNEDQSSHAASGTPTASSKPQRSTPTGDQQEGSNQASCHTPQQVASSQASYSVSQSSQRAQSASTSRRQSTSRGDTASRGTSSKGTSRAQSAQSHRVSSSSSRSASQAAMTASNHSSRQSSRARSANSAQSRPQSRMYDDGEASGIGPADASRVYTPVSGSSRPSSSQPSSSHHGSSNVGSQHRNAAVQCPTPTSST